MPEDTCTEATDQARPFSSGLSVVSCDANLAKLMLEVLFSIQPAKYICSKA